MKRSRHEAAWPPATDQTSLNQRNMHFPDVINQSLHVHGRVSPARTTFSAPTAAHHPVTSHRRCCAWSVGISAQGSHFLQCRRHTCSDEKRHAGTHTLAEEMMMNNRGSQQQQQLQQQHRAASTSGAPAAPATTAATKALNGPSTTKRPRRRRGRSQLAAGLLLRGILTATLALIVYHHCRVHCYRFTAQQLLSSVRGWVCVCGVASGERGVGVTCLMPVLQRHGAAFADYLPSLQPIRIHNTYTTEPSRHISHTSSSVSLDHSSNSGSSSSRPSTQHHHQPSPPPVHPTRHRLPRHRLRARIPAPRAAQMRFTRPLQHPRIHPAAGSGAPPPLRLRPPPLHRPARNRLAPRPSALRVAARRPRLECDGGARRRRRRRRRARRLGVCRHGVLLHLLLAVPPLVCRGEAAGAETPAPGAAARQGVGAGRRPDRRSLPPPRSPAARGASRTQRWAPAT